MHESLCHVAAAVCPRGFYEPAPNGTRCNRCDANNFCPGGDKAEMPISRGTRFSCGPNLVTRNTGARTPIDCGETGAGSKSLLQHRCGCTRLLNGCGSIHMGALAIRVESATAAAAACDCMIWKHDRTSSCCGELLLSARFSCGRAHCDPQP